MQEDLPKVRCFDCDASLPWDGSDSQVAPSLPSEDHKGGVVVCRSCAASRQSEYDRQVEQSLGAF